MKPCVFCSCRHHLYLDVHPVRGSLKINFPDIEPHEMAETCALDVADKGTEHLEEVGKHMNLTRERVRQYEVMAISHLKDNGAADVLRDYIGHESPRQMSPMGVGLEQSPDQGDVRYTRSKRRSKA